MFDFDRSLREAKGYIEREDVVQGSEKLYKCGEEVIKFLAKKFELPEYEEAQKNGRWDAGLLFKSARKLSDAISPELYKWWAVAWVLHVEGFHEMKLSIEEVIYSLKEIENLVKVAKRY